MGTSVAQGGCRHWGTLLVMRTAAARPLCRALLGQLGFELLVCGV